MCGIFCSVRTKKECPSEDSPVDEGLLRRGPDHQGFYKTECDHFSLHFQATVLHMRGEVMEKQPFVAENGNIFCWNGEVFGGYKIPDNKSDTTAVATSLDQATTPSQICNILASIQGPWAFVYFEKVSSKLWFGRDYFGRRSLLLSTGPEGLMLSSIRNNGSKKWVELPASGIYCLDLSKISNDQPEIVCYPWVRFTDNTSKEVAIEGWIVNTMAPIQNYLSTKQFKINTIMPDVTSVMLDKSKAIQMLEIYYAKCAVSEVYEEFLKSLQTAVQKRLEICNENATRPLGILFSGGIDCTVIAALSHLCLATGKVIDLINVAFEQKKSKKGKQPGQINDSYMVPDRITGLASWQELKRLFPNRQWNFITVNITVDELISMRNARIGNLTYPKETVLDDSIACAIWFAARAKGKIMEENMIKDYTSDCRIILCGIGADEQLGGYSRHRGIFENCKDWDLVGQEMNMDIERISERNMGRDDRVISDHGKEARFPFLDENVARTLAKLPVYLKSDYRLPHGVGEKILLRCAAYKLGLRGAAILPKRAIQFGSRIAKAENRKEKGSDSCPRLNNDNTL